jgi:hypothetical protein
VEVEEDGCLDSPVPHGAVEGLEDVGAVVEGEACYQDAALGAGEEFADHDGGVAGGAGGHVGAGPHEIDFGVLAPTALGQDGNDRGQDGAAIQPHQPSSAITNRQLGQRRSRQRGWREALANGTGDGLQFHIGQRRQSIHLPCVHGRSVKKATPSCPSAGTTRARSRYWLKRSHEHSATNRQP